jgi:hypothetical protein
LALDTGDGATERGGDGGVGVAGERCRRQTLVTEGCRDGLSNEGASPASFGIAGASDPWCDTSHFGGCHARYARAARLLMVPLESGLVVGWLLCCQPRGWLRGGSGVATKRLLTGEEMRGTIESLNRLRLCCACRSAGCWLELGSRCWSPCRAFSTLALRLHEGTKPCLAD